MGNCSPTSPLTREHSTDNKLGQGRGRRSGAQILILTKKMSDLLDISPISSIIQDGERGTVRDKSLASEHNKMNRTELDDRHLFLFITNSPFPTSIHCLIQKWWPIASQFCWRKSESALLAFKYNKVFQLQHRKRRASILPENRRHKAVDHTASSSWFYQKPVTNNNNQCLFKCVN